jgi:hypothetical protein
VPAGSATLIALPPVKVNVPFWLTVATEGAVTTGGDNKDISHIPRPCVAAARMFVVVFRSKSTTCAFGNPVPATCQLAPLLKDT